MVLTTPFRKNYPVTETTTNKNYTMDPSLDSSQPTWRMTASDESPSQEVRESLLGPKAKIHLGAWNVRTMCEASKTAQVIIQMKRYGLDILGISECRWTGSGRQVTNDGSVMLYSGHRDAHIRGVALIV